jgi:ATP-binding cassette subfamily F protein 3
MNRYTIEVFDNTGSTGFPFQRISGAQIQKGTVGTFACCVYMDAIAFIGGGRNESPGIYVGANGNAQKISTREIEEVLQEYTEAELRTVLGCFLFTGDEVFKKIKVLSGGEKSRVALAKTLLTRANLLLLDEPTNHLDMFSTSVLADAVTQYKGTCVIVSHDRTFVSHVATKIWWIENGHLREYPGSYDEWNEWMQRRGPETYIQEEKAVVTQKPIDSKSNQDADSGEKKPGKNRLQQLEQEMAELEKKIQQFRDEKAHHEKRLAEPDVAVDFNKVAEHNKAYQAADSGMQQLQAAYDKAMEAWIAGTE